MSKPTFSCILIVVLSLGWPIDTCAKTKIEPPNDQSPNTFGDSLLAQAKLEVQEDLKLINRVKPVYPSRAKKRDLEGYVDIALTVTATGTVKDPVVLFSTSSLFDSAAIQAVLKFRYKPRVVDGTPVEVQNVKTRITFELQRVAENRPASAQSSKSAPAVRKQVYEEIMAIDELAKANDYENVFRLYDELSQREGLSDYERANIWNYYANYLTVQNRYGEAIRALEQVLAALDSLGSEKDMRLRTLKTMTQLQSVYIKDVKKFANQAKLEKLGYAEAVRPYEQLLAQPDLTESLQLSTLKALVQLQSDFINLAINSDSEEAVSDVPDSVLIPKAFSEASCCLASLEEFVKEYPVNKMPNVFQQTVEDRFIELVFESDLSNRFVLADYIESASNSLPTRLRGSVTILVTGGLIGLKSDLPKDRVPVDNQLPTIPLGHGSVWRFSGKDKLEGLDQHFSSNAEDPLRFVLVEGKGLVYLYGKGVVTLANGTAIRLPPM